MLSKQRQGEIALAYLKNKLRKKGVQVSSNAQRQIANTAKEIGISFEEAMEFAEGITRELVEEAFAKPAKK